MTDITRGIVEHESLAPLGCHYFLDGETATWEVTLFVSRTEVIGGSRDGQSLHSRLSVDLGRVGSAFDSPPMAWWQADSINRDDELGSHVSFEGLARGNRVWLRILHHPPAEIGPGRLIHSTKGVTEDIW